MRGTAFRPRGYGGCSCHGETFCPDLIGVGYEDDIPIFVRRDSPEGRAAVAREHEQRAAALVRDAAPDLYAALANIIECDADCIAEGAASRLTNGEYDKAVAALAKARGLAA
jgi:hypothetical protein